MTSCSRTRRPSGRRLRDVGARDYLLEHPFEKAPVAFSCPRRRVSPVGGQKRRVAGQGDEREPADGRCDERHGRAPLTHPRPTGDRPPTAGVAIARRRYSIAPAAPPRVEPLPLLGVLKLIIRVTSVARSERAFRCSPCKLRCDCVVPGSAAGPRRVLELAEPPPRVVRARADRRGAP